MFIFFLAIMMLLRMMMHSFQVPLATDPPEPDAPPGLGGLGGLGAPCHRALR